MKSTLILSMFTIITSTSAFAATKHNYVAKGTIRADEYASGLAPCDNESWNLISLEKLEN